MSAVLPLNFKSLYTACSPQTELNDFMGSIMPVELLLQYLHPGFRQVDLEGHLLSHEDVWVAGLGEQCLQDVQLCPGEGGALPTLLPGCGCKNQRDNRIRIILVAAAGRRP